MAARDRYSHDADQAVQMLRDQGNDKAADQVRAAVNSHVRGATVRHDWASIRRIIEGGQ